VTPPVPTITSFSPTGGAVGTSVVTAPILLELATA
jgi:hypothetical protein